MKTFEELVHNNEIEFFSYTRKLKTDLKDFGEYNWELAESLTNNAGNKIVVSGNGLEEYLREAENLYYFADFLVQLRFKGANKYSDISIHVKVDIDKLDKHYQKPKEEKIVNYLGQIVGDASNWVPEMSYFEKSWNHALDTSTGGMVGYPGYEHPSNDESFRYVIENFAENYMIGTPEQVKRYEKYALDSFNNLFELAKTIEQNSKNLSAKYSELGGLERLSKHAKIIAENIAHFSKS